MSSITITIPTNQDARVQAAIGLKLGLVDGSGNPVPASGAQVKQWMLDGLKLTVLETEQAVSVKAAKDAVTPITPT